jgi:hypothetical protein
MMFFLNLPPPNLKTLMMRTFWIFSLLIMTACLSFSQPDTPVEKWTGKTILLIGAHPDDDTYAQGTLGLLQSTGNEVYIAILTTGNVGTQDPELSMVDLANIRKQEEQATDASQEAMSQYVSQWSSGCYKYEGPDLSDEEAKQVRDRIGKMILYRDGKAVEGFRYYKGLPDDIGR